MITLRQHIELTGLIKDESALQTYLKSLGPVESVILSRQIQETYPLKKIEVDYDSLPFKAHTKVFDLVLGQFIMIEQIFTGKEDIPKHLFDYAVLRLILRPKHHTEFDNTNKKEEEENSNAILDLDAQTAISVLADFVEDRNKTLFTEFAGVFYEVKEGEEEEEKKEDEETQESTFEYKFKEQWYWYNIVRRLGGENILNYDKVYMLKMEAVLPELSFLIQKAKVDKAQEFRNRAGRGL
jgi:hypothetical protein